MSVYLCVPKSLANRWTDKVLLYNVASYLFSFNYFWGKVPTTILQSKIAPRRKITPTPYKTRIKNYKIIYNTK